MVKSPIGLSSLFLMCSLGVAQNDLFITGGVFAVGNSPRSIAVADFNGDGRLDLATANYGDNTVTVLLGDGTGHFAPGGTFATGSGPVQVLSVDFNRDGKPDLAILNSLGSSL